MMNRPHCKCGSTEFIEQIKLPHIGIYCKDCGKWQTWRRKTSAEKLILSSTYDNPILDDLPEKLINLPEIGEPDDLPWEE